MSQSTQTWNAPSPKVQQPGWLTRLGMRLFGGRRNLQTNVTLSLMALPGVLMLFVFAYLPMAGLVIAFKDYRFAEAFGVALGSALTTSVFSLAPTPLGALPATPC